MEQIIREYDETKRNADYVNARKRMHYLHMKLTHIKNMIMAYDSLYKKDGILAGNGGTSDQLKPSRNTSKIHATGHGRHDHNSHHQPSRSKMLLSSS